jgi:hypothetical protein
MMSIEFVDQSGARIRIPRGWVIVTLALASWGVVSIIAVALWGLTHLLA